MINRPNQNAAMTRAGASVDIKAELDVEPPPVRPSTTSPDVDDALPREDPTFGSLLGSCPMSVALPSLTCKKRAHRDIIALGQKTDQGVGHDEEACCFCFSGFRSWPCSRRYTRGGRTVLKQERLGPQIARTPKGNWIGSVKSKCRTVFHAHARLGRHVCAVQECRRAIGSTGKQPGGPGRVVSSGTR